MKITLSVIKADVGSIGGHTKPSAAMLGVVSGRVRSAVDRGFLIDGVAVYTGDDIAIIMSHRHGSSPAPVHQFAWGTFVMAAEEGSDAGLYAAGQDLLADAPTGSVRGAGPAVAEIERDLPDGTRSLSGATDAICLSGTRHRCDGPRTPPGLGDAPAPSWRPRCFRDARPADKSHTTVRAKAIVIRSPVDSGIADLLVARRPPTAACEDVADIPLTRHSPCQASTGGGQWRKSPVLLGGAARTPPALSGQKHPLVEFAR